MQGASEPQAQILTAFLSPLLLKCVDAIGTVLQHLHGAGQTQPGQPGARVALVLLALVLLELSGNVPRWTRPPQTAALGIAAALRAGRSVVLPSVKLVCKAEPVAGLSLRCVL